MTRVRRQIRMRLHELIAVAISLVLLPVIGHSDDADGGEELKAVFITQLARFVEWPQGSFESETSPIRVGVLGNSDFYGMLQNELRGAQAGGRSFDLRYLDSIYEALDVHIVVITSKNRSSMRRAARVLREVPVLSIGPSFRFAENGGILGIEIYEGKVAFEVNNKAARDADIRISSRVLKLATTVY